MSEVDAGALAARIRALRAGAGRHRRGLIVAGGSAAALAEALRAAGDDPLWVGSDPPAGLARAASPADPRSVLGQQCDIAVLDLTDGAWPDALGAVAGAVIGGGVLILRIPRGWGDGRFPARLARVFDGAAGFAATDDEGDPSPPSTASPPSPLADDPDCLTADQAAAVRAVLGVATGRRKRPVVLVADRGRGKSAALGIAAGRLLRDGALGGRGIALIAPSAAAVAPVFEHARRVAGAIDGLRFVAPAELAVTGLPEAGLILVDEAAALPVALLGQVLAGHPRVVFSTTVHGYEGTGRGFAVRFTGLLDRVRPQWRRLRLDAPIRYGAGDPVEAAVFRALLLDARPVDDAVAAAADPDTLRYGPLDRDALAADEPRLRALFGLLVSAHYRTSPADLERLLDGPRVTVWAACDRSGAPLAAALVTDEGRLDPELSAAIHRGGRRPAGHMLPETLAAHLGLAEAPRLAARRVVRIAVHPAAWGRGIGSRLLTAVAERSPGVDYLGSAFGATARLLRFWDRAGFAVARVGLTRGRSSGLHSAVVLRPLSPAGARLVEAARRRFAAQFAHALAEPLRDLDPAMAAPLFGGAPAPPPRFGPGERDELALFAAGRRVYGAVIDLMWRLAPWAVADPRTADAHRRALVARVLQRRPPTDAAEALGLSGRRALNRRLGEAVAAALERVPG